jgi:hypothetical protein
MELILYPYLCTRSRRAMRRKNKHGKKYFYNPKSMLIENLQIKTNMGKNEIYLQLLAESEYLKSL